MNGLLAYVISYFFLFWNSVRRYCDKDIVTEDLVERSGWDGLIMKICELDIPAKTKIYKFSKSGSYRDSFRLMPSRGSEEIALVIHL